MTPQPQKTRSAARTVWALIAVVFVASAVTWFFRESNSWLTVLMWVAGAVVGVYGLVVAVRERRAGLGVAAALTVFADAIVFAVMFAGSMIVQGGFAP